MPSADPRQAPTSRIALFDNARLVLMALVVTGHLLQMGFRIPFRESRAMLAFIYAFHMPLFVFLSGLFVRRERLTRERVGERSAQLLALGLAAKVLDALARVLVGRPPAFSLVSYGDISWFMVALAAFLCLAYLLRRAPAVPVGACALVLSLAVGYVPWVGDTLCLSRIAVFFPYFWLGCLLDPRRLADMLRDRRVRAACAFVLVGFAVLCLVKTKRYYRLRNLFKGRCWYGAVAEVRGCSWTDRLRVYAISAVVGAAALGCMPQCDLHALTGLGARTRQVYLLHYPVLYLLRHGTGIVKAMTSVPWGWLLPLPASCALTLLLAAWDANAVRRVWEGLRHRS